MRESAEPDFKSWTAVSRSGAEINSISLKLAMACFANGLLSSGKIIFIE